MDEIEKRIKIALTDCLDICTNPDHEQERNGLGLLGTNGCPVCGHKFKEINENIFVDRIKALIEQARREERARVKDEVKALIENLPIKDLIDPIHSYNDRKAAIYDYVMDYIVKLAP